MISQKLDNETYEYIKEVACHLISHYKIRCVPISGFEIAAKLNIALIPYSSLNNKKQCACMNVSQDGFL